MLDGLRRIPRAATANARIWVRHRGLRDVRKVLYALTPPASLSNVGDHAQVVAIRRWLDRHFPDLPVFEVDKREAVDAGPTLSRLVGDDDLILLHSGGNLGDRGLWSESARRSLIERFANNVIVSLPQTIFFSDTEEGRRQRAISARVYGAHRRLTVIGRDPESFELARELFPRAKTFAMPDFVLSLPARAPKPAPKDHARVLLCLRRDSESALSVADVQILERSVREHETRRFDTTLDRPIRAEEREAVVEETLDLFSDHDAIVTDRYHGVIFAILCRRPCVVLRTVDHKLTSAMHWFSDVPFVRMASDPTEVPRLLREVLATPERTTPDWNAEYFDRIPEMIAWDS